jgi:hypothetical protein
MNKMTFVAAKKRTISLQKTERKSLRRCLYSRWDANQCGRFVVSKNTKLQRMYRGNTLYPIKPPRYRCFSYATAAIAKVRLNGMIAYRLNMGYNYIR